jgi:hypothetical protein
MNAWPQTCSGCGADASGRVEGSPCAQCGDMRRTTHVTVSGEQAMCHSMLDLKARHGRRGEVAPYREQKSGDSLDHDTGRWLELEQVVDRENNWYRKRLVDKETGELIRDEGGPLDQHRPHTWRKPT